MKSLTVIIPAFNEERSIGAVTREVLEVCSDIVGEVIVVDDCSRDGTALAATEAGARVLSHRENRGYGAALKTGIMASRTDFLLTMDGDGQHRARDVRRLWERARDNDMVVGKRPNVFHTRLWRLPGKWLLWLLANYLVKSKIPDLNSGMRVLRRREVLKYLHICPAGFSFSTTITLAFVSRGQRVEYVPIKVQPRVGHSTVKIKTGFDTMILILRIATLFNPLRLFLPLSFLSVFLGVAWGLPIVMAREGVSIGAMLAVTTGMMLFFMGLLSDQVSQLRLERFETHESPAEPLLAAEAEQKPVSRARVSAGK